MAISEKDTALMVQVAEFYRTTQTEDGSEGSIRLTAKHFDISRNKVRKILVTTGDLILPWTDAAIELREKGLSIKEIAASLGVSLATVSISLPYEDKINYSLDPSEHAAEVREYRAYERNLVERQNAKKHEEPQKSSAISGGADEESQIDEKEWEKDIPMSYNENCHRPHRYSWEDMQDLFNRLFPDAGTDSAFMKEAQEVLGNIRKREASDMEEMKNLESLSVLSERQKQRLDELHREFGLFPGALTDRDRTALEGIARNRLPPEPYEVIRLHLELFDPYETEETKEILKTLGGVQFGEHISRDLIVPVDLPLYALHYVIQRVFGWRNSHLHQFTIYEDMDKALIHDNASMWSCLVGVVYRSPLMDEDDQFWADDYTGGSEKNWLRKKYTGPYLSQCHGEGILSCQDDMMSLDMKEEYYLVYVKTYDQEAHRYTNREYLSNIMPVFDRYGRRLPEPTPLHEHDSIRIVTCPFESIPAEGLRLLFEQYPFALLERLPISSVLTPGKYRLSDDPSEHEFTESGMAKSGEEIYSQTYSYIMRIIRDKVDSPEAQVDTPPFTNELLYEYDFGDSWQIIITASWNCEDLVESGRISQSELDRANVKCRETYRPVLIARDGEMLMDDVGGLNGFVEFLDEINPDLENMNPEERDKAKQIRKERLDWAKGMGWKKGDAENINLL